MKRDYPDRPLVGVGAVIVQDGRAVIVERSTEPLKGQWSIPGGALELGETLRQCAAREALEETGLQVEAVDVLDVFDSIYRDPDGRTRYHYVLIDFFSSHGMTCDRLTLSAGFRELCYWTPGTTDYQCWISSTMTR